MKNRSRIPKLVYPTTLESRIGTNRTDALVLQRDPLFEWDRLLETGNVANIIPSEASGSIIIPFHGENKFLYETFDPYTIDLGTSGIGGLIDGLALVSIRDYLVWAFYNPLSNTPFIGFGASMRPVTTGASTASGGGLGASATFTVTAGHGNRFTVGARITVGTGVAVYNQGVITAVSSTSISADMDATYSLTVNTNVTLAGGSGLTITQLNMFAPYLFSTTEHSLYPGGGTEYIYTYIGCLQRRTTIQAQRKRGDFYFNQAATTNIFSTVTAGASSVTSSIGCGFFFGQNVTKVHLNTVATRTVGTGIGNVISVFPNVGTIFGGINLLAPTFTSEIIRDNTEVGMYSPTISFSHTLTVAAATTVSHQITIPGWQETHW